jgi:hypothetical protein
MKLRLALLTSLVSVLLSGCLADGAPQATHRFSMNGYELEYDGITKSISADSNGFSITRDDDTIRVGEGKLWISNKDFGPVKMMDLISVVGGVVSINGKERKLPEA